MRQSFFYYKELTPAEAGTTGTHEVYVRLPNNFDYETFFGNDAVMNGTVMEINFTAQDITNGGDESIPLRFVYFQNSNKEKRIPSLAPLFRKHDIQSGDIVSLESRIEGGSRSYYICFYKKGEIQISPSSIYFSQSDRLESKAPDSFNDDNPLQQIFYGAPGTGKSHTIKREVDDKGMPCERTTFHPDSDYSTFVGAYKPTTVDETVMTVIGTKAVPVENPDGQPRIESKIVYEFVPQAFLKAYTGAWKDQSKDFYLIIEEINRGNCAQIFGDLFQLLDRNDETGRSKYPISPDQDIKKFLLTDKKYGFASLTNEQKAAMPKEVLDGERLVLPKNLHIWATMNTSDQSLFPIDSAFKRRWDWQYIPISNANKGWKIKVNGKKYDWWDFLEKMNEQINTTTNSEDKKMGYFFCKAKDGIIDAKTFVGKVVFYVWNDVFKDFANEAGGLFKDEDSTLLSFNKFYRVVNGKTEVLENKVEQLLKNLGVEAEGETIDIEVLEEQAPANSNKNYLKEIVFPDGTTFSTDNMSHFDAYMEAIRKIGVDRVASVAERLKYRRLNRPLISAEKYDEIENSTEFTYYQEGDYYFVKGAKTYTLVRILEDLNEMLNVGMTINC